MKILLTAFLALLCTHASAENLIWEGEVNSNGTPSPFIELKLNQKYNIKVSGVINTNKWHQAGQNLGEDACFDFAEQLHPVANELIKSSLIDLDFCKDGLYHPDHVYESHPFVAKQSGVHFWVNDDDYTDNTGAFKVQVFEL